MRRTDYRTDKARRSYELDRAYSRALAFVVHIIGHGMAVEHVAEFIRGQSVPVSASLSRMVEDAAFPGTYAEKLFNILSGEA